MAPDTSVATLDPADLSGPDPNLGGPSVPRSPVRPDRQRRSRAELTGLVALLVVTATAYLWNLTASGYANSFYAAAVQAGTKSWKAFFFGSIDSSNFITVDKPPASLWVMELFGRVLGFSSFSMLLPEVLEGVATVALIYAIVRRWYGHRAGLLAGAVLATTPVAALMFRFNNPDALLVLLMTAAAYCVVRAVEVASTRWLVLAGTALGFAFLAKMGQALMVVPGFGLTYLVASPAGLRRRLWQLIAGLAAMVVAAGWWVLTVTLWPAGSRPMIDGSSTNSIWNLIVGYNGLGRLVGSGGSGGGSNFSGSTGLFRLFNSLMGGQASWLIPVAVISLVGGLALSGRSSRQDRNRAGLIMWGSWLILTAVVFSYGQGVIHTYYTVALAPAIAALIAIGAANLSRYWDRAWSRWAAAGAVTLTASWAVVLLDRTPNWYPWLRPVVIVAAAISVIGFGFSTLIKSVHLRRSVAGLALAAGLLAGLAGPTAYTVETLRSAHTGSIPSAGPTVASSGFGGGPAAVGSRPGGSGSSAGHGPGQANPAEGGPEAGVRPGGSGPAAGSAAVEFGGGGAPTSGGGSATSEVSSALSAALKADSSRYRWVAATDGSENAASLELATGGEPVMAIGGFNNQGGNLSLAQFEKYVAAGDIHYFISSGSTSGAGGPGGSGSSSAITSWVQSHFTSRTVGGQTVYDLTDPIK